MALKRGRFREEQIVWILREHEAPGRSRSWLGTTVSVRRRCMAGTLEQ